MDNETLQALERIEAGMGGANDKVVVRRALLNVAPSSAAYKRLSAAAGMDQMSNVGDVMGGNLPGANAYGGPTTSSVQLPFSGNPQPAAPGQPDSSFATNTLPSPAGDIVGQARAGVGPPPSPVGPTPNLDAVGHAFGRYPEDRNDYQDAVAALRGNDASQFESPPGQPASVPSPGDRPFGLATNNVTRNAALTSDYRDMTQTQAADPTAAINEDSPADIFSSMPAGYSFSDMNRSGIEDMLRNPERYATTFSKGHGGEQYAGLYADPAKAAIAMARSGVIGPGGPGYGDTMQGAVGMPEGQQLQAVEDFMRQYATKGVDVRPEAIYSQMFGRLGNTDFSTIESPQTHLPMQTGEIIDYTNSSLMAAAPFMSPEGQAWISSILANAGNQYLDYIGTTDEVDPMSYPAFLQNTLHLDELMQGQ